MKFFKGCLTLVGVAFALIFGLAILGFIIGGDEDNNQANQQVESTSQSDVSQESAKQPPIPVISVTAAQLMSEYDANELAADQKYKGKVVKITGKVNSIQKMMGSSFVTLGSGKEFEIQSVQAFFDESYEGKLAQLQKGQSLTIQCTVDGKGMGVSAKECSF